MCKCEAAAAAAEDKRTSADDTDEVGKFNMNDELSPQRAAAATSQEQLPEEVTANATKFASGLPAIAEKGEEGSKQKERETAVGSSAEQAEGAEGAEAAGTKMTGEETAAAMEAGVVANKQLGEAAAESKEQQEKEAGSETKDDASVKQAEEKAQDAMKAKADSDLAKREKAPAPKGIGCCLALRRSKRDSASEQSPPPSVPKQERDEPKARYLPKTFGGVLVLVHEGGSMYRADKTHLKVDNPGIQFRNSKNLADKDAILLVPWGALIRGADEGEWVKVQMEA